MRRLRLRLITSQGSPYPSRSPRAHPSGWTRIGFLVSLRTLASFCPRLAFAAVVPACAWQEPSTFAILLDERRLRLLGHLFVRLALLAPLGAKAPLSPPGAKSVQAEQDTEKK